MDWKLLLGVVVATLLAVSAVVALWQWSEHKAAYYQNQMQKSLSDYDFIRANEFAKKAEKAGVNGLQNEVLYQEACYLLEQGAYLNAQETFLELGLYKEISPSNGRATFYGIIRIDNFASCISNYGEG